MIKDELAHVLSSERDSVDEQFNKNLTIITGRAFHVALQDRFDTPYNPQTLRVCLTVFWAYYRSVYRAASSYGGIAIVIDDDTALEWLACLLVSFLGLRDVEAKILDGLRMCPAMRDNKDAAGYNASRVILGLPFDGMMSWDVSNVLSCCSIKESIILTRQHPSQWSVSATKKGDVIHIEESLDEVFDLRAALREIKAR